MFQHLYVHIPFCPKICPYCSFYKSEASGGGFRNYVEAVLAEANQYSERLLPKTIFFGGGTPTALNPAHLTRLINGLRDLFDFSALEEFTVEMNPATVSPRKADTLLALGVNRASMGIQSWDTHMLDVLGRVHSADMARDSFRVLRDAGFSNINLDHIFGIPGQTREVWTETLNETLRLAPEHISAYSLTYEEDTAFFDKLTKGEWQPDPDLDADLFELTLPLLASAGFLPYETSNFARPGFECRHNAAIWRGSGFLGLGASAVSTDANVRWQNIPDTSQYIERIRNGLSPAGTSETLSPDQLRLEHFALALRTTAGIDASTLADTSALEREGLVERSPGRLRLTKKGWPLADEIILELQHPRQEAFIQKRLPEESLAPTFAER